MEIHVEIYWMYITKYLYIYIFNMYIYAYLQIPGTTWDWKYHYDNHENWNCSISQFLNFSLDNNSQTIICTPEPFSHSRTLLNAFECFSNAFSIFLNGFWTALSLLNIRAVPNSINIIPVFFLGIIFPLRTYKVYIYICIYTYTYCIYLYIIYIEYFTVIQ